ncbi:MAG TPA: TadE family protein [Burkholderiales bacterium]|jgi:hypothetical protein|nr:TadE family protein [Burkholderiales bacterium]
MNKTPLPIFSPRHSQHGAAIIEVALTMMVFLVVSLGIMELGRIMYLWNTVQEVTRRAAREAVVRDFTSQVGAIQREAIFRSGSTGAAYLPAGLEISNTNIQISYLNASLSEASPLPADPADNLSACGDASRTSSCIRFVEACVATNSTCTGAVTYVPMAGLFPFLAVSIPVSSVVMPAESLGFNTAQ